MNIYKMLWLWLYWPESELLCWRFGLLKLLVFVILQILQSPVMCLSLQGFNIQIKHQINIFLILYFSFFSFLHWAFPAELHCGWKFIFVGWLVLAVWAVTLLSNSLQWLEERCFMRYFCSAFCLIITVEMSCILFMVMIELLYRN